MRPSGLRVAAFLLAIALLGAACWAGPHPIALAEQRAAPAHGTAQSDDRVDIAKLFDAVVDTIDQQFFDEAILRQVDWRARAATVRPSVLSAATPEEAVSRINALLSDLKTSHTALFTPDDYEYYILLDLVGIGGDQSDLMMRRFWGSAAYYPGIGAFTRRLDGRHFIDGIMQGSPADRAGLRYGDEILSVDGRPYTPIAVFRDKVGRTVDVEVRREVDAQPRRFPVSVIPIAPAKAFSAATAASAKVIERDGSRIGYVHVWAVHDANPVRSALMKLVAAIWPEPGKHALDSLIVDMRGRVGGNMAVAQQLLEMLDARKPYWGESRPITRVRSQLFNAGEFRIAGLLRQAGPDGSASFRGHSALLIDHRTRSAGEIMAYGYKRSGFGPVVGTPTAGAVSSGRLVVMPGDMLLYVAVSGHEFADKQRLEGIGVRPDHHVERTLPYANGADPVLDAAMEILTKPAAK